MTMRMSIAALLAALICTGPAAAQAPVSSLQFINTSTEAVDVLFDSHAVLTDFEARGTTGHYHTLYVTHTVAAVTGADTVTVSQRFRTGAHCHVFVAARRRTPRQGGCANCPTTHGGVRVLHTQCVRIADLGAPAGCAE